MKSICKNCQYFREGSWCSNSQSPMFRYRVLPSMEGKEMMVSEGMGCKEFYQRGKKAPLWMRTLNKALAEINRGK